jgi:hypothetical protein
MEHGVVWKDKIIMRRLLFIPIPVVVLVVAFGLSAVGQGHAQSPARHTAQGSTITQSINASGPAVLVSLTGQADYVGVYQEKLSDGSTASESFAGTDYTTTAKACFAGPIHGTRTFAKPAATYDLTGVLAGCFVSATQGKNSGNAVITGGTGRYKGATGSQTWTSTCTLEPPKTGQPYTYDCTSQASVTITLAGH